MMMRTPPTSHAGSGRQAGARPPDERLAFNYGTDRVAVEHQNRAAAPDAAASPAVRPHAEPRFDWGYGGLLAFTTVLLLRPQDQIHVLGALHLAQLCAVVGIGGMVLNRFTRRLPLFHMTPEIAGLIAFGLVILATAPFSMWPGGAIQVFADSYLKIAVVFVLMVNTLTTPRRLEQLTWLIVLCCGYIAFRAVFDYARGVNLVEDGRVAGAVGGIFGNPNDLALNMVTFMPAALMIALTPRHSGFRRMTAGGIAVLMLATVVFTKSRGGVLGLTAMLVTLLLVGRLLKPAFAVAAIASVLLAAPFVPSSFWNRMATIMDEQQDKAHFTGSAEARRVLLQEGFDAFVERPLTGVGAGQFVNYNPNGRKERWRETHNTLLQVAADTGVFGFAAFVFLIGCGAIAVVRTRRLLARPRRRHGVDRLRLTVSDSDRGWLFACAGAMSAGLVGWFTCALFASVAYSWTFYYVLALAVATRELVSARLAAARTLQSGAAIAGAVPSERLAPENGKGATLTPRMA